MMRLLHRSSPIFGCRKRTLTRLAGPLLAAAAIFMPLASASEPPARLTLDRLFAAPDLSGPALRGARFSPDGKLVTYLQGKPEAKDRLDVWAYDPATRSNRLLVDSAALVADEGKLSAEEEARRERARTFARLALSAHPARRRSLSL
jgi:dipeptidyl-peptidase-4